MAIRKLKKVAVDTTDIGNLKSSRYEKLQVSYGSISAASYELLDTLVFADVPARDIIRATIVAHTSATTSVSLEVYPATDSSVPLTLSGVTAACDVSYVIEYVRGSGRVGPEAYVADAYGSGQALESGEGDLLQVIIGNVSELNTTQIRDLTTSQVAGLTTQQVVDLTSTQIPAIETRDIAVLNTKQLRAMETRDVAALTSVELAAMTTTQLHAFSTAQTAVLTTVQKAGLTTTQIAALQ